MFHVKRAEVPTKSRIADSPRRLGSLEHEAPTAGIVNELRVAPALGRPDRQESRWAAEPQMKKILLLTALVWATLGCGYRTAVAERPETER